MHSQHIRVRDCKTSMDSDGFDLPPTPSHGRRRIGVAVGMVHVARCIWILRIVQVIC